MILLNSSIALLVTATSCLQPVNAGGGIKPGVARGSAGPQELVATNFKGPRMRAAALGLSPGPRVWGISSSATWGSAPLRVAPPQALCCRLFRGLKPGSHSIAGGGIQGEAAKSKQPPQGKQQGNPQPDKPKQNPTPPVKKETTVQWLLRFLGISAAPSAMKGEDDNLTGDLWLYDVQRGVGQRIITRQSGFRSPIVPAGDANVLALKGEQVVEVAIEGGEGKPRATIPGIVKLVGVNAADANQVLFLRAEGQRFWAGLLSLGDGRIEARELDLNAEDDRRMLAHLRGWERVYDGGKSIVYTKAENKEGLAGKVEWRDVYLKREGRDTVNVSNCDGVNCGQPSLSPSGRWVVYIKSAR